MADREHTKDHHAKVSASKRSRSTQRKSQGSQTSTVLESSFAEILAVKVFVAFYIIQMIQGREGLFLREALDASSFPGAFLCAVELPSESIPDGTLQRAIITDQGNSLSNLSEQEGVCVANLCEAIFDHAYTNRSIISSIHIVGYASPDWEGSFSKDCYDKLDCNMKLSGERAANVYRACRRQIGPNPRMLSWYDAHVYPVGGGIRPNSSSQTSRRVEFRYYFDYENFRAASENHPDLSQIR